DLNLVIPDADSATTVLTGLLKESDIKIDRQSATYLLTGILTDTSNFANPTTHQTTFQAAAYLMNQGAKLAEITNYTFKNKSLNALRFWGQALMRLKLNQATDVATTVITQQDFKLYDLEEKDVEGLANFLIAYSPHRIIMVLRELGNNQIKGSLRSASEADDVSRLAKALGGGGHKKAAAFVVPGKLRQGQAGWEIV
ncbi:MAG: DHHA1 domain-containing protein, partial [bacterium]